MRCHIVPPHMLERIARDAEDPAPRDCARSTLALTSAHTPAHFPGRRTIPAAAPTPVMGLDGAGVLTEANG